MSNNAKIPLKEALALANTCVEKMRPYCDRIEILGSIRRKKQMVGDCEILVIPKFDQIPLFGYNDSGDRNRLAEFLKTSGVAFIKNGDKYKQFTYGNLVIDLFFSNIPQWGIKKMIRTGSAVFSRRMVTRKYMGGYMPNNYVVKNGRVWMDGKLLNTLQEEDVFVLWGMRYWEPEERE